MADHSQIIGRTPELQQLLTDAITASPAVSSMQFDKEVANTLALAQRMRRWVTVLAELDGHLCAALIADVEPDRTSAFIRWLVVAPSHRRQGIGTRLMDHFEQTLQPEVVRGQVDLDDTAATAFWTQRGWASLLTPRRRIPMGCKLDHRAAG